MKIGSAAAVVVLGVSGLLLTLPGTAGAATTTGTTTATTAATPTSCSTSTTMNVTASNTSSAPVTTTLTATSCPFKPGSTVSLSFLGTTQSATADATTGLLTLSLAATDPTLSVNGGAFATAAFGVNTITGTGTNAAGGTNTATFLVDIESAAATTTTTTASTGSGAGGLAFTGADLAALIAAAFALILLGTAVVIYTRRRANSVPKT